MKRILLTAVIVLLGLSATAQTYKATGVVVDSTGAPLAMANVIAYQKNKSLGAFGITNQDGKYQLLNLKQDSTYTVKVSFLGLKPLEETFKPTKTDIVRNFMLVGGPESLDAVEITYQIPVTIKGDTITYNADSFTNGTEKKLGDVLKKLPGMEVNDDGDIQVEGKGVTKVLVDGKEFFEGDSRLATKNIPANAVGKVEVLKNYNNQSQLKGLGNDEDNIAINIRLKAGMKKFWFGEITAAAGAGGDDFRHLVKPKAFYYSENFSMNILTDFNNIGVPAFTFRDFFRFTGFGRGNTRDSGSSINVASNAGNLLNFQPRVATNIDSKFGAISASIKASPTLDISGYGIFSSTKTGLQTNQERAFIQSGLIENTIDINEQNNNIGLFKLGLDYKPNKNFSLDYDGTANVSDLSQDGLLISQRESITENINELNTQNPISVDQSLNMYYTASDNDIFALETQLLNQDEDPFYNAIRDVEPFVDNMGNGGLNLQDQSRFNINQQKFVRTTKYDAQLDYFRVLGKKSNINVTVGTENVNQNFDSSIFQILDNGNRNNLNETRLINNVRYEFRDIFAGLHYKVISGKFTITPGFTAHTFKTTDFQNNVSNQIKTTRVLPDANIRYQIRSSETLTLDYRQAVAFTDVENYANGIVFNSYNALRQGNNQLEGSINDRIRLNYFNFNMFNYTNINGSLTYTNQRDALQSNVVLDGINQVSSLINSALPQESLSANGRYGREFGKIQAGLSVNYTLSTFNNIINNEQLESRNFAQIYGATVRTNYKEGLNADGGYTITLNDNKNGSQDNTATTHRFNVGLNYRPSKAVELTVDYDYNLFTNSQNARNDFQFLEAAVFYSKPDSKWEYKLAATNLLNTTANINNNFGQFTNSTTSQFVLPRYAYFQIKYEL